jgi:hypothetical protein
MPVVGDDAERDGNGWRIALTGSILVSTCAVQNVAVRGNSPVKTTFLKLAGIAVLMLVTSLAALADSTLYVFGSSAPGSGSQSTPVTINLTFRNGNTATLSTGVGFQYFPPPGYGCDGSFCYFNQGWWTLQPGGNGQVIADGLPNSNYLAGLFGAATYRDFFTFDTSILNATDVASGIDSGQFVVTLYNTSPTGTVQFVLSGTTLSTDTINGTDNRGPTGNNLAVFADLGNGLTNASLLYGSGNLTLPGGTSLTITLNGNALTGITNAANGSGGTGHTCDPFGSCTDSGATLFTMGGTLLDGAPSETPEPSSLVLIATGLVGITLRRRRRS